MSNNNKISSNNSITSTRRKVLGVTTKGSTLLVAKAWLAPTILGVTLPVHAQTSTTKKPGTTSTSGGSDNGGGSGGPSNPGTTATPGGTVAPPTPTEPPLVCSPGASSNGSIPLTRTPFNQNIALDQYDLQVGNLSRVVLNYTFVVDTTFQIDNRADIPQTFTLSNSGGITMFGPNGSSLINTQPTESITVTLDPSDGIPFNFEPPSGYNSMGAQATASGSIDLLLEGLNPDVFIGTGSIEFAFEFTSLSRVMGGVSNETVDLQAFASAEISIQYECEL